MEEITERLDNINQTLKEQNMIFRGMLDIIPRPESKFTTTLQTVVLIIGALGFVNLVDVIIKWVGE